MESRCVGSLELGFSIYNAFEMYPCSAWRGPLRGCARFLTLCPMEEYLGYFHFGAIMKRAAVTFMCRYFVWTKINLHFFKVNPQEWECWVMCPPALPQNPSRFPFLPCLYHPNFPVNYKVSTVTVISLFGLLLNRPLKMSYRLTRMKWVYVCGLQSLSNIWGQELARKGGLPPPWPRPLIGPKG